MWQCELIGRGCPGWKSRHRSDNKGPICNSKWFRLHFFYNKVEQKSHSIWHVEKDHRKQGEPVETLLLYFRQKDDEVLCKRRHGNKDIMEGKNLVNILWIELTGLVECLENICMSSDDLQKGIERRQKAKTNSWICYKLLTDQCHPWLSLEGSQKDLGKIRGSFWPC